MKDSCPLYTAAALLNTRLNSSVPARQYLVGDVVELKLGHYKMPEYIVGKAFALDMVLCIQRSKPMTQNLHTLSLRAYSFRHIRSSP